MKAICEFYRKGLYFCRFRWLPIEGGDFVTSQIETRGNLNTTPIMFISHLMANFSQKSSQLNSERQFEHCPHNLVLYIYVP